MFVLDVEIETALTGVDLVAFGIGAVKCTINLIGTSSIVLLAPGNIPLSIFSL